MEVFCVYLPIDIVVVGNLGPGAMIAFPRGGSICYGCITSVDTEKKEVTYKLLYLTDKNTGTLNVVENDSFEGSLPFGAHVYPIRGNTPLN